MPSKLIAFQNSAALYRSHPRSKPSAVVVCLAPGNESVEIVYDRVQLDMAMDRIRPHILPCEIQSYDKYRKSFDFPECAYERRYLIEGTAAKYIGKPFILFFQAIIRRMCYFNSQAGFDVLSGGLYDYIPGITADVLDEYDLCAVIIDSGIKKYDCFTVVQESDLQLHSAITDKIYIVHSKEHAYRVCKWLGNDYDESAISALVSKLERSALPSESSRKPVVIHGTAASIIARAHEYEQTVNDLILCMPQRRAHQPAYN